MNLTDPVTLVSAFQNLFGTVKVLVGGLFGIYVILALIRWYEARVLRAKIVDMKKELKNMRYDIQALELKVMKALGVKEEKKKSSKKKK